MNISSSLPQINTNYPVATKPQISNDNKNALVLSDKFEHSEVEQSDMHASKKLFGAVGAAIGHAIGKVSFPVAMTVLGGVAGSMVLGPAGAVLGSVAGAALGGAAELKGSAGSTALGMAGGAIGEVAGMVADKAGHVPQKKLADATKNFTLKSLFAKLQNHKYTSQHKITMEEAKEIKKILKPGDIIIGNNDDDMRFELAQKAIGASGNWTHACIVKDQDTVIESLIPKQTDRLGLEASRGYFENRPEDMITRNHHLMILRPAYSGDAEVESVLKVAESMKNIKYDLFFNMNSDDKMYCTELVYKALKEGAPEIPVTPGKFLGLEFVTADHFEQSPAMEKIYTTGSDFAVNYLSKFA